ncbi:MAG: hypothetical protein ACSLEZ_01590 [Thiobacillus sp.]
MRTIPIVIAALMLQGVVNLPLHAQKVSSGQEGPTTLGMHAGAWVTGNHTWPRAAINLEHGLGSFIARLEAWGVSRPEVLCSGSVDFPECDDRRTILGLSLGGRLMDRDGDGHPYLGAGFGGTRYVNSGGHVYLEAGLRYDIADRWGAELRLSADMIGEGHSVGGASTVNLGAWYVLR